MNKKDLSESDICDKFIRPAMEAAGWNGMDQIYREFPLSMSFVGEATGVLGLLGKALAWLRERLDPSRPVSCARLAKLIVDRHSSLAADWGGGKGSLRKFLKALDLGRLAA